MYKFGKKQKKEQPYFSYSCKKYKMGFFLLYFSLYFSLCLLIPVAKLLLRPCSFFESFLHILLYLFQRQNACKTA